ncbi:hypothetical protein KUTeg_022202 [Tegillarca granosa]|uniref:Uncharacterized protein n=1 Tax=Tegillarca granosa TaxID=220873 RepID=A0ABQ9E5J4_TEGGR|nr:hypothetical protein KUTeg_022202 [Tegillarca granosa]
MAVRKNVRWERDYQQLSAHQIVKKTSKYKSNLKAVIDSVFKEQSDDSCQGNQACAAPANSSLSGRSLPPPDSEFVDSSLSDRGSVSSDSIHIWTAAEEKYLISGRREYARLFQMN